MAHQGPGYGGYPPSQEGYVPVPSNYPAPAPAPGYPPPVIGFPQPISQQPVSGQYHPGPPGPPAPPGPAADGWMSIPQGIPSNIPPGLEYLTMIDQLLVKQKVELLEAFTGFETANKYAVKNSMGQKVYYAMEDTDCCTRNCCGSARPFDMKILDNFKREVIHLYRPLACQSCCFPCCLQRMEVYAPLGTVVGYVEQKWSLFAPRFDIKNASGDTVLKIEGPICQCSLCCDVEFQVLTKDGSSVVGKISKQWSGLGRELFTDADFFGITFPMDLDVRMKAVMLGACFLIDFMYFETTENLRHRSD